VVEQGGESFSRPFSCYLPHTVQSLGHACPALYRVHVRLNDVLLSLCPSLPGLRGRLPFFVRLVTSTTAQSDFSCTFTSAVRFMAFADRSWSVNQDVQEISRFMCMLFLSVRGFSDYAGPNNPLAISVVVVLPSSSNSPTHRYSVYASGDPGAVAPWQLIEPAPIP